VKFDKPHSRLYDSRRWRKVAKAYLDLHPLCQPCLDAGRETPATIVHHKTPHKGDLKLFWDEQNLESACATCHSGTDRIADNHGYSQACDENGLPLDANHPWAK
jgi:5-methylcytosine-specific restriction protein A